MYAERLDRKRSRLSARSKTREYKKKRREQREKRSSKVRQLENRKGVQNENSDSPVEIPPPTVRPEIKQVTPATALKKVAIDLETSSRGIFIFFTETTIIC